MNLEGIGFDKVVATSNPTANRSAELSINGLSVNMGIPRFSVNEDGMTFGNYIGTN